ncbi:MAG: hypothetical protein EOM20_06455 [Spartobacteria bacterium]|nr:hypothetical protein [Spartobacteria bacterium]
MGNDNQSMGHRPPPPPPPLWGQAGPNHPVGMSIPRILLIILTIVGLYFIFRVVNNYVISDEAENASEATSANIQASGGEEGDPSSDLPTVTTPFESSTSGSANTPTDPSDNTPPTINPAKLKNNLSVVEADLRRLRTLPDLTVYIRIARNMQLMALAQIAILESLSDTRTCDIDVQSMRATIDALGEIDDNAYKTYSIAKYSMWAAKTGQEVSRAITTDNSNSDLRACAELLDTPDADLLRLTRDGALALVSAYISAGKASAISDSSSKDIWANYARTVSVLRSSEDHILRQIEQAHQLLFDVLRSCCILQDSGQTTKDKLAKIDSNHKSAMRESKNLFDKIGAHSDASVQALILFAQKLPSCY